jgi:uncharacterized metal-binding protein
MPDLPQRKVGIVACSGEELAEGTVTRLAALKVLHELRPGRTVTICLPLFLAGGEGDRAFARFHPTIAIDGCELRCAARGTERYSAKPAASIVIRDEVKEHGLSRVEGRRQLNQGGRQAVEIAAQRVSELVDKLLGPPALTMLNTAPVPELNATKSVPCSCASDVPSGSVTVNGTKVSLAALPLIFKRFRELGRKPETAAAELLATVRIYNFIPREQEKAYGDAIATEYAAFCRSEGV